MPSSRVAEGSADWLSLISATFADAVKVAPAGLRIGLAYCLWSGVLGWTWTALPAGYWPIKILIGLISAYIYCLYSLNLFARLLAIPKIDRAAAIKLVYATLLFLFLTILMISAIILFFTVVGASIGIVSGAGDPAATTDIIAQMRDGGTFWPMFALFLFCVGILVWFIGRLFLFSVATAATGRIHIFRTWAWTKPHQIRVVICVASLVLLPNLLLVYGAELGAGRVTSPQNNAVYFGLSEIVRSAISLPLIWLNHALAVNLFRHLAPAALVQATTLSADSASISLSE